MRKFSIFNFQPACRTGRFSGRKAGFSPLPLNASRFTLHASCRGIGLLEIVIGTSLVFLCVTGVVASYSFFIKKGFAATSLVQSTYLLEEGLEAATLMRDTSWATLTALTAGTPYYLVWSNGKWNATTTSSTIDGVFGRTITISNVYRDASDNIAAAGTLDAGTRKVTVSVTFASTTKSMSTYLTNLLE